MSSKVSPELARKQLAEMKRLSSDTLRKKLKSHLFQEQLDFLDDPARFKAALCSRRAGKTVSNVAYMLDVALANPNCTVVYISITRDMAKRFVWDDPRSGLLKMNRDLQLNGIPNNHELRLKLPNGAIIWLVGCDDKPAVERLVGGAYHLVIIDEAQGFNDDILKDLVYRALDQALADYQGTLVLTGTPGVVPFGPFYDITEGNRSGWSVHKWTQMENIKFPEAVRRVRLGLAKDHKDAISQLRQEKLLEKNWSETTPEYVREHLGKWFVDFEALLYKYDPRRDIYDKLPEGHVWRHVLGIDFGYSAGTAFVIWAYADTCPVAYEVLAEKRPKMDALAIIDTAVKLAEEFNVEAIVADPGYGGSNYVETLNERFALGAKTAEKTEKAGFIELLNADLAAGRLKVRRDSLLAKEWENVERNPRTGKEKPGCVDDLCDAGLYAFRELNHLRGTQYLEANRKKPELNAAEKHLEYLKQKHTQSQHRKLFGKMDW